MPRDEINNNSNINIWIACKHFFSVRMTTRQLQNTKRIVFFFFDMTSTSTAPIGRCQTSSDIFHLVSRLPRCLYFIQFFSQRVKHTNIFNILYRETSRNILRYYAVVNCISRNRTILWIRKTVLWIPRGFLVISYQVLLHIILEWRMESSNMEFPLSSHVNDDDDDVYIVQNKKISMIVQQLFAWIIWRNDYYTFETMKLYKLVAKCRQT